MTRKKSNRRGQTSDAPAPTDAPTSTDDFAATADFIRRVRERVATVVVGQDVVVERLLISLFTGGHILLQGVPGLAKTLLVSVLSKTIDHGEARFGPDGKQITGDREKVAGQEPARPAQRIDKSTNSSKASDHE